MLAATAAANPLATRQTESAPARSIAAKPPPVDAKFDYQIGDPYRPRHGVRVLSRDWYDGKPLSHGYSVCYVNAFQTQDNYRGADRPDERSNWPRELVLRKLGDDPHWGGEYLVNISTSHKRRAAARWVQQMIDVCAAKGYDAVEYDNLDSWTRFNGTPLAAGVPFGKPQALAYAKRLARRAHALGLAVAQKNTSQLSRRQSLREVGFDFAIAEECGRYRECGSYRHLFGNRVLAIEYRRRDFRRTCARVGAKVSVVLRDRLVTAPGSRSYRYDAC